MKLITLEVSDCSLAVTTVKECGGRWDCSIVLSHVHRSSGKELYGIERKYFDMEGGSESALGRAAELTNSFIDHFFPESAEAA